MKLLNKLSLQDPLWLIMISFTAIVHGSSKKSSCNYYLSDINLTVGTIANRQIIFFLSLTPEKSPVTAGRGE